MTVVTMPDGVPVDFGDMPPDQIKSLIQKKFPDFGKPPTDQPWYGEEPGIAAKILHGFGSIATGVEDVMSGRVDPKSDQGIANITDAAALTTPVSPASRAGYGWMGVKSTKRVTPKTPTAKELHETGDFGFKLARQMDVQYTTKAVQNMAMKLQSKLHTQGYRKTNAKGTLTELKNIVKPSEPGAFATIDDLHSVRQALDNIPPTKDNNPNPDYAASRIVVRAIDEFITRPDPKSVVAGPAASAGGVWKQAMGDVAAGHRSDRLVDKPFSLQERMERRRNPLSSGSADKAIRDRVGALLDNPNSRAGFSKEEIALLETVKDGTAPRNVVSFIGNLMGTGFSAGSMVGGLGAGFAFGGPIGAAAGAVPGAVVLGAKALGGALTKRALNKTAEKVRQRSPLYEERVATAPPKLPASPATRSMMGRGTVGVLPAEAQSLMETLEKQQITPQMYDEYLRQKYARDQGA